MEQTRRRFLKSAGLSGAALVVAPQALASSLDPRSFASAAGGTFAEGVISGDPTTSGITLWTRLHGIGGKVNVELEVARDKSFRKVVARQHIPATGASNHAVKARVSKLKAHEQYWYRFSTPKQDGPVGRFRTALSADSNETVKFAYFSCQEYAHGWYNAHALMAEDDLDFVVCLGDYIYAETYSDKSNGRAVRQDNIGKSGPNPDIVREALTLADYRAKYKLYRSDANLRKVHAKFPMLTTWDDHELQDNYAGGAAGGGLAADKHYGAARKKAAVKAFFEAMPFYKPTGTKIYRTIPYGRNVEVFVMDQRQYRADQPCDDAVAQACADWDQPRDFLGRRQMDWLKGRLSSSKATWKIMANELMIMPTKVLGDAYYTFDSWQGYPREREELLQHIKTKGIKDVVFVTGDIHTFIAGDVRTNMGAGEAVALEFVGGSITSQGLGEIDLAAGTVGGQPVVLKGNDAAPNTPQGIIDTLKGINSWVDKADFDHHGYGRITARRDGLTSEFVRLETIKRKTTKTLPSSGFTYDVAPGQTSILGKGR